MTEGRYHSRVLDLRPIGPGAYELTFERAGLSFKAGQCLTIHDSTMQNDRSYSLASGEQDQHLKIVFKLIPNGKLTPRLVQLKAGDEVEFSGPFGEFVIRDPARPIVFIATGTGIAPCLSFLRTYPGLDVTIVHGVREEAHLYYRDFFARRTYFPCVSRQAVSGTYHGRVTEFWKSRAWPRNVHYYLCGSNDMIFDMRVLLQEHHIPESHVFTEAYYYRLFT